MKLISFFLRIKRFILNIDNIVNKKLLILNNNLITKIFSHIGGFIFCLLIIIMLYFSPFFNSKLISVISFLSLTISTFIVFIFKYTVKRRRIEYNDKSKFIKKYDPYSFPSGHISRLSLFIPSASVIPIISIIFLVLIFLVSVSRISRGYHFLSDCVAGFLIGLISGLFAVFLVNTDLLYFILKFIEL
ncbi:MAG: phosphatase PAP2 family protein [Spirochaetes bacterium]|nr:phosphatase PAP2 family protein [Spirochaetota bacterium]